LSLAEARGISSVWAFWGAIRSVGWGIAMETAASNLKIRRFKTIVEEGLVVIEYLRVGWVTPTILESPEVFGSLVSDDAVARYVLG